MTLRETVGLGRGGAFGPARQWPARARALLNGGGERGRTGRGALLAFFIRVAGAGLAYASQVLLARWMGGFEYGVYVFVWVWVLILGGLATLGLSTAVIRFVPEYRETARPARLRGLLLGARLLTLAAAGALTLGGLAVLWAFPGLLADYYWLPGVLVLFSLPAYALVDVQDGIARGFSWLGTALAPPYIIRPLLLLAAMAVAALAGLPLSAVTAAGCAVFACWAAAVLQTIVIERRAARDIGPGSRDYDARLWLVTALPLILVLGFELLLQNTDILVLSRYLEPDQVGVYYAALKTMGLISFVHFAVGTAAANRFSALRAQEDHDALSQAVRDAVRWTFWPSLAGAVLLLALGRPLLWLFGPEFTAGYSAMFILAAGFLLRAAMGPAEFILNMLGEQNRCAAALSAAAALNLALNFALVPLYGIHGAAAATAISVAAMALALYGVARRRLGLDIFIGWRRGA